MPLRPVTSPTLLVVPSAALLVAVVALALNRDKPVAAVLVTTPLGVWSIGALSDGGVLIARLEKLMALTPPPDASEVFD